MPDAAARMRAAPTSLYHHAMRVDEVLANKRPVFSIEFFPPKTDEGIAQLYGTVAALEPLKPDYVSVTYGAGGATRDGTVEVAERIHSEYGIDVMAHLSCVGETRDGLATILDRFAAIGDRERARPARRPAARRRWASRRPPMALRARPS